MPAQSQLIDVALERAVQIWSRRHSGTWTQADEAEVQRWLTAAPEHRAAYEEVASLWNSAGQLQGRMRRDAPKPSPLISPRRLLAICACLLVLGLIPLFQVAYQWWAGTPVHWSAHRGEPKDVTLDDGTRVQLDADSEVVLKFGARVRRVSLVRGEALFSVVHDAFRPFEVETGTGHITALGTRFDVETLADSTRVSVFEGRVGITSAHGEIVLTSGHGSGFDSAGRLLPVRQIEDSGTLWSQGERHFEAERLRDVVARLARYHAVTFVFSDPQLKQLRVSGTFRMTDLDLFLRTLAAALPIEARWVGPQRVQFSARTEEPDPTGGGAWTAEENPGHP